MPWSKISVKLVIFQKILFRFFFRKPSYFRSTPKSSEVSDDSWHNRSRDKISAKTEQIYETENLIHKIAAFVDLKPSSNCATLRFCDKNLRHKFGFNKWKQFGWTQISWIDDRLLVTFGNVAVVVWQRGSCWLHLFFQLHNEIPSLNVFLRDVFKPFCCCCCCCRCLCWQSKASKESPWAGLFLRCFDGGGFHLTHSGGAAAVALAAAAAAAVEVLAVTRAMQNRLRPCWLPAAFASSRTSKWQRLSSNLKRSTLRPVFKVHFADKSLPNCFDKWFFLKSEKSAIQTSRWVTSSTY